MSGDHESCGVGRRSSGGMTVDVVSPHAGGFPVSGEGYDPWLVCSDVRDGRGVHGPWSRSHD